MTKRTPAARRRPVKRTTRKPGVLAALRALLRSLFNRPAPASGGGGAPRGAHHLGADGTTTATGTSSADGSPTSPSSTRSAPPARNEQPQKSLTAL
ncbi:MAG: hypothetical protein ACRDSP_00030 [Pseudonocardiaceae bacterium]